MVKKDEGEERHPLLIISDSEREDHYEISKEDMDDGQ